ARFTTNHQEPVNDSNRRVPQTGPNIGLGLGAIVGLLIGWFAFDSPLLGLSTGIALGWLIGVAIATRRQNSGR
ncbi:MAG: hypothetical protein ACTHU1_05175, partial [Arachnia sp.]